MPVQEGLASLQLFQHCFQGFPTTQPSSPAAGGCMDAARTGSEVPGAALPRCLASSLCEARSSPSPSATHLRAALLLHLPFSFAPPVLRCFSCRPLLSPPPLSHILLHICSLPPSRRLHLLLLAPSIMHFCKMPPSTFNFCFPSTTLPARFRWVGPHFLIKHGLQGKKHWHQQTPQTARCLFPSTSGLFPLS